MRFFNYLTLPAFAFFKMLDFKCTKGQPPWGMKTKGGVILREYDENGLGLENVSEVMTDYTEQESSDEEQKKAYEGYLQLDESVAEELSEVEQSSRKLEQKNSRHCLSKLRNGI